MLDDVRSILRHARARDLDEMRECGLDFETVVASFGVPWVAGRVFAHEGRPVAVLAFHDITPRALAISMFATDECLISVTVAALWWASDLTRRVKTIEQSTVTAERIARLETQVNVLADNTKELKGSISELVHELRRHN